MPSNDGALYLLHFDPPVQHARHYLGYVNGGQVGIQERVQRRLDEHRTSLSKGSPLVRAAVAQGSTITLARTWVPSDRTTERKLKNRKNAGQLCPICQEEKACRAPC